MSQDAPESQSPPRGDAFVTTRWTVVLSAGRKSSPDADRALAELCQTYWYPLYAYVRRQGHTKEDAEDLTQAFFARFLEKNYLEGLAAERGKFRAFLLAALKHFLANEWDRSQRQKRGAGVVHLSLDWHSAEERFHLDPPDPSSPDKAFDREWALALLEKVMTRLRQECGVEGKAALFEQARGYLQIGEAAIPYATAARALGLDEGAVRVAVYRLRQRYRQLLRNEIAQTLADPAQAADELRSLQAALAS
ncbi:MAG TPA: sigma-70 family RNA polymerase sigma factor [Methylomirabilota bacterium]|nr:sigma-70 family RNA polymerase sigma factor [Methylomirabilota bacterium]